MLESHILITGASSGIGREFARQLAGPGSRQTLVGRSSTELDKTKAEVLLRSPSTRVDAVSLDLCSQSDREKLVQNVAAGELDFLILNAGGGAFGNFLETPLEAQLQAIELNLTANVHLLRELVPLLLQTAKRKGCKSRLILVSSHAAFFPVPRFSVYASAKTFLNRFARTLAIELNGEPIEISILCPGATATRFSERAGIPPMLSRPMDPAKVVSYALSRRTGVQVPSLFDRLLRWVAHFAPGFLMDRLTTFTQAFYIRRQQSPERGIA